MKEKWKWGIKSGIAVIAFLISDVLFTELYAFFLMNLNGEERLIRLCFQTGSVLITLLLSFPVFILVMRFGGKLPKFSIKGMSGLSRRNYLVYAALALLPIALLSGLELFLIRQGQIAPADIGSLTPENAAYTLLAGCFLLPVMEEIMFRGVLLHSLLPLGTGYAIVLTTCFFVMIHYNNPVNMLLSVTTGLVLAHMAVRAKSIMPTILFHMGINLLGQVIFPLCIRYIF